MIAYHGTPLTPVELAIRVLRSRHAFVSFEATQSLGVVMDVCQSFALDNGAYSAWSKGVTPDWDSYYLWVDDVSRHPGFDFAVIPDVIDGDESANDKLLNEWPHGNKGIPVWHLHESFNRLIRLCESYPKVALGSSGAFSTVGTQQWWLRMNQTMDKICDGDGYPKTKLHGLRMLNPEVFSLLPLSSADSTMVAQNKGVAWRGQYEPKTASTKAIVLAERIELSPHAYRWRGLSQKRLF